MRKTIITSTLLSALVFSAPSVSAPTFPLKAASWSVDQWTYNFTANRQAKPTASNGELSFYFPTVTWWVSGIYDDQRPHISIQGAALASVTFRIETTGVPVFNGVSEDQNTCNQGHPRVRILLVGSRDVASTGKWFSEDYIDMAPGAYTLNGPLGDPARWRDASGKLGNDTTVYPGEAMSPADGYQLMLGNVSRVEVVFGDGCFYGHGIQVNNGTARFVLGRFEIR